MFEQLTLFNNLVSRPKKKIHKKVSEPKESLVEDLSFYSFPVTVNRVPRKNLSAQIKPSGKIQISCAKKYSRDEILGFLEMHKTWVFANQNLYFEIRSKFPEKFYQLGEPYSFLGKVYPLQIRTWENSKIEFGFIGNHFYMEAPKSKLSELGLLPENKFEAREALRKFYKSSAEIYIRKRVDTISESMCLRPKKVSLRSQKTLWGSCSPEGNISLNWKLMAAPAPAVDYVIIHELAHLEQPNHSKLFWSIVETHCPNYKTWRNWLRDHQFSTDFLALKPELFPL